MPLLCPRLERCFGHKRTASGSPRCSPPV